MASKAITRKRIHEIIEKAEDGDTVSAILDWFLIILTCLNTTAVIFSSFHNILAALWCAVVTLTTVGYGDVYPVTVLGKLLSGIISILGVILIALPSGIISSGFVKEYEDEKMKEKGEKCG
jgi:voltage-gated potassium channel Kch